MIFPPTPDRRLAVLSIVVVLVAAALIGPLALLFRSQRSSAAFGDAERLGTNHLGAATLDIAVGEQTAALAADAMAPGERVLGWVDLANRGELALRYSLSVESADSLVFDWLTWDIWIAQPDCTEPTGPGGRLVEGMTLGRGVIDQLVGNPASGLDPGDRMLLPGEGERLCIAATLRPDTPNAAQGQTTSQTVAVFAEHHLEGDS